MDEPTIPAFIALYDYQQRAIDAWKAASFRGIFDMATGTGKTITALCAMVKCYEALRTGNKERARLAVLIVCPFRHLVEQWVEDVRRFGIKPIVGYGTSAQTDWRRRLKYAIEDMKHGIKGREFFAFVTTNATFASDFVQGQIKNIRGNALLIVDEAHNFGAEHLRRLLPSAFNFRLALSATLERYGDADGTQALKDYFGQKCIEYGLEQAMADGILTPYKYHPVIVNLSDKESEDYERLSREIGRCLIAGFGGKRHLTERGKHLALQRAHIVAGAANKLEALKAAIMPYRHDKHILVYCGAAQIMDDGENDEADNEDIGIRQIDAVTSLLGNTLNMRVARFTSRETMEERFALRRGFEAGNLQALVAIKCLDEGVNIPQIKTAFILASTMNPREYVQRRGRVLRRAVDKEYAEIYDFITLPYSLDEAWGMSDERKGQARRLVINEAVRAADFARLAMNEAEIADVLEDVKQLYNIEDNELVFKEEWDDGGE